MRWTRRHILVAIILYLCFLFFFQSIYGILCQGERRGSGQGLFVSEAFVFIVFFQLFFQALDSARDFSGVAVVELSFYCGRRLRGLEACRTFQSRR